MIPRLKPTLGWHELTALFSYARADEVSSFESDFANLVGQEFAVAFPYGRTGLALLLESMNLRGKEVICPAYTCIVVPHAIVTSGCKPVFVDSQETDFNMNLDLIEEAITNNTGAIIATSLFGYPVDLDRLREIQKLHPHIRVIQDCAHSFVANWKGEAVNKAGDAAVFGLNISKLITSIFGGMVTTNCSVIASRLRKLRDTKVKHPKLSKALHRRLYLAAIYIAFNKSFYRMTNTLERSSLLNSFVKYYDEGKIDMPQDYLDGITPIEAAIGRIQIPKYQDIIGQRVQAAKFYDESLCKIPGIVIPPIVDGATYSHYVLRFSDRQLLLDYALKNGIQLGQIIEYSIPSMKAYQQELDKSLHPISDKLSQSTVNLPVWGKFPNYHQQVVNLLHNFFKN